MKSFLIGVAVYIFGFILVLICSNLFDSKDQYAYYYAIIFSILYLCSVIGISTSLILNQIKEQKNSESSK